MVSSKAAQCPNCGIKIKGGGGAGCGCLTLILLTVVGAWVFNDINGIMDFAKTPQQRREEQQKQQQQQAVSETEAKKNDQFRKSLPESSADAVVSIYTGNEIAADEQLKNKWVKVTGTVDEIKRDFLNTSYVTLRSKDSASFRSVQCYFNQSDDGILAKLAPGESVTITGRCEGLMGNVLVKECRIEQ